VQRLKTVTGPMSKLVLSWDTVAAN